MKMMMDQETANVCEFMEHLPFLYQLSQTHLQILDTCPRKFQHLFLDQVGLPQPSARSPQQQLGVEFHQLMQQQHLGLEIQPLLADNPQLQVWFQRFQDNPPPMIDGTRHSEYQSTLALHDFLLIGIYDLLILGPDQAQIIDWKTYQKPPRAKVLQQHWQSRLYPFLLAETSSYMPEQISMTYWFAESPKNGLTIPYSVSQHQQTQTHLSRLLPQLRQWMQDFAEDRKDLSQVPLSAGHCMSRNQQCMFIHHCQRLDSTPDNVPNLTDLMDIAAIAEVPFE